MHHNVKHMNIFRLVFACLLVISVIYSGLPAAQAAEASGSAGDLAWSLDSGVLTISGRGDMPDYQEFTPAPWNAYADQIQAVVVEEGVASVGDFAFFRLENLLSASVANSVTKIGQWAFYDCSAMETLALGNGVKEIGQSAFERCRSLLAVRLPAGLETIRFHAFYRCESLTTITVPASVTNMEHTVFAYCSDLRTATVLATIPELPLWTFYGCYELNSVTLGSSITSVGVDAFEGCDQLNTANYTGSAGAAEKIQEDIQQNVPSAPPVAPEQSVPSTAQSSTIQTTQQQDGSTITKNNQVKQTDNSTIQMEKVSTKTSQETSVDVTIDAVLDNAAGWADLEEQVNAALASSGVTIQVRVRLLGEPVIAGEDLARFAGKNVRLTILTRQNIPWHIYGENLDAETLADSYTLSMTVNSLTEPNEKQTQLLSGKQAFTAEFASTIDFKLEVEVPLNGSLARQNATLFDPGADGYTRAQTVVVNADGAAHLYLAAVDQGTQYLIGINVPVKDESGNVVNNVVSDAIIPTELQNEYPALEQYEQVEYVVTGVKSSLGINIGQLTWILFGVMGGCVIVIGVVVYILFKRKLKAGYVPDMSYAEETPRPPVPKRKNRKSK